MKLRPTGGAGMKITMIGHSTVLLETGTTKILADPYFRTSGFGAYARITPPFKTAQEMLYVDLVLVSHGHWDHCDYEFIRLLAAKTLVIAPKGLVSTLRRNGSAVVSGMGAWEEKRFGDVKVTAVPASHIVPTQGYVVEADGKTAYFAGDTYYRAFHKEIGKRFRLDVALIPVSTYRIPMTMGERGALKAVKDLSPKIVIPIHLGIRPILPVMRTKESPERFRQSVKISGLETEVVILREGEHLTI